MATNQPTQQHFLPRTYLAGFSENRSAGGRLFVANLAERSVFPTSPEKAARERDLYNVTVEGEDPYAVERELTKVIDDRAAPTLIALAERPRALTEAELGDMLYFVALQAVRVPSYRDLHTQFMGDLARRTIEVHGGVPGLTAADVAELAPQLRGNPEAWVVAMVGSLNKLWDCLAQRQWGVAAFESDAPDLFCSDRPVMLVDAENQVVHEAGFGLPHLDVLMPLSRRAVLVGSLSRAGRIPVFQTGPSAGARALNRWSACSGYRWLYAHADEPLTTAMADPAPPTYVRQRLLAL